MDAFRGNIALVLLISCSSSVRSSPPPTSPPLTPSWPSFPIASLVLRSLISLSRLSDLLGYGFSYPVRRLLSACTRFLDLLMLFSSFFFLLSPSPRPLILCALRLCCFFLLFSTCSARVSLLAILSEFEISLSATTRSGPASDATSFLPDPPSFFLSFSKMPVGLGYDESGSLATYFALTFLSLALVPSTYWTFRSGGAPPSRFRLRPLSSGFA